MISCRKRIARAASGPTLLALLLVVPAAEARADDEPVESLRVATAMFASMNPFTVLAPVSLSYQHRLYATSSPALRHNYFEASATMVLGPLLAPRVRVAIHPTAFFDLGVSYGLTDIFIKTIEERRSPASSYDVNIVGFEKGDAATFQTFTVDTTLQGSFGPFFVRSANSLSYTAASLASGETVYYSSAADMLLPAHGWLFSDDTTVAFSVSPHLRIGVTETLFATAYPASAYAPGQSHAGVTNSPSVRIGPSFSATLRDEGDGPFARIELFGAVQWYAVDRYRTGGGVDGAIPFALVGARFGGTVWKR